MAMHGSFKKNLTFRGVDFQVADFFCQFCRISHISEESAVSEYICTLKVRGIDFWILESATRSLLIRKRNRPLQKISYPLYSLVGTLQLDTPYPNRPYLLSRQLLTKASLSLDYLCKLLSYGTLSREKLSPEPTKEI